MIKQHDSIVVKHMAHFMAPIFQLFALYVLFHGHYSPGGGFQAGVMIGASLMLEMLVGSRRELKKFNIEKELRVAVLGLGLYAFAGGASLFYGSAYFDYGWIRFLGEDMAVRRYWAILIAETGVTMVVAMTAVIIFQVLAFLPNRKETRS